MKKIFITLLFVFFLMGCATFHDVHGNPVSKSDEFECNDKCGFRDARQSPTDVQMCIADCLRHKGYFLN